MLQQRAHRQPACLGAAPEAPGHPREVVGHRGGMARVGAGRRVLQRLAEAALGLVEPPEPQVAGAEHLQGLQPRFAVGGGAALGDRVVRGQVEALTRAIASA